MKAIAGLLLPILCLAQETASTPKRYALVVGNSAYNRLPALAGAVADARLIKTTLENAGFAVMLVENATMPELLTRDEAGFLNQANEGRGNYE